MIDTDKYEGHTPVPWLRDSNDVHTNDGLRSIADVVILGDGDKLFRECVANARLIADAPLLLQEVKHLRMIYEELYLDWRKVWDILDNMGMAKEMRQHFPNTFADTMEMIE